jgi:hypothetical protein
MVQCGSGSSILGQCRSGSGFKILLNKIVKLYSRKQFLFLNKKLQFLENLQASMKDVQATGEAFKSPKRGHPDIFPLRSGSAFPSSDPDPADQNIGEPCGSGSTNTGRH